MKRKEWLSYEKKVSRRELIKLVAVSQIGGWMFIILNFITGELFGYPDEKDSEWKKPK